MVQQLYLRFLKKGFIPRQVKEPFKDPPGSVVSNKCGSDSCHIKIRYQIGPASD